MMVLLSVTGEDEGAKPLTGEKGKLLLHADTDIVPVYYQTWTIGMKKRWSVCNFGLYWVKV